MAPGITEVVGEERFEARKASKLDAIKALNNGYSHGGRDEEGEQMNGRSDVSTTAVNNTDSPAEDETPVFTMPSIHKLREAQRRVEHDFRSDTVTVPTVHMMQVSSLLSILGSTDTGNMYVYVEYG